jgi:tRNA(His) 5'-end guanylyltransferase
MKFYEEQYANRLLTLIPICARLDGRSFHQFTKGLQRPHDENFCKLMVLTTKWLVEETQAKIGYCQSDEISLIWYTDKLKSSIFFDGRMTKMTSVLASMGTCFFNKHLPSFLPQKADKMAFFDCRVWQVPTLWEATNYLIWRETDATRNSVSMAAQSMFSHKELQKKNASEMQEMMFQKHRVNWNDYPSCFKRGTYVQKKPVEKKIIQNNQEIIVVRNETQIRLLPPLKSLGNREEVVFNGALPVSKQEAIKTV